MLQSIGRASTSSTVKVVPIVGTTSTSMRRHSRPTTALSSCEPLQCGERVDRAVFLAAAQDLPDHGMDRLRLGGKEIPEFHQPFRHPRALIQQRSGGQEGLQGHIDDCGYAAELLTEGQVGAAHLVVAEELQLVGGRQPDSDSRMPS